MNDFSNGEVKNIIAEHQNEYRDFKK